MSKSETSLPASWHARAASDPADETGPVLETGANGAPFAGTGAGDDGEMAGRTLLSQSAALQGRRSLFRR